jgi:hypothetical protein
MAYIADHPESYEGKSVGTGHCVPFVQAASCAPETAKWKQGLKVKGNSTTIFKGTAIATFAASGKYTNSMDGTSHAAIYIDQDDDGLQVWDQWKGKKNQPDQPVHKRTLRFQEEVPGVLPVNNGNCFYVID